MHSIDQKIEELENTINDLRMFAETVEMRMDSVATDIGDTIRELVSEAVDDIIYSEMGGDVERHINTDSIEDEMRDQIIEALHGEF